jgi:hypothetical protein
MHRYAFHMSLGQGHQRSCPATALHNASSPNMVLMLMSRSLTGRHLPIRAHQHFGQRLHLVWTGPDNTKYCTGYFFFFFKDLIDFCHQLTGGGAVNIASCVPCPHMSEELKLDPCPILPPKDEELGTIEAPLFARKCEQECRFPCNCGCIVDEYHFIDWE